MRVLKNICFVIAVLSTSALVEASNCSSVDIRNQTLGSVRNQDDIGWCYAFGAADLLSYKFQKKISAANLALLYYQHEYNNLSPIADISKEKFSQAHGGSVYGTADMASQNKVCTEDDFPSEDHAFALAATKESISTQSPPNLLTAIKHLENAFEYFSQKKYSEAGDICEGCNEVKKAKQLWPSLDFNKTKELLVRKNQSPVFAIMDVLGKICEEKKNQLPSFKLKSFSAMENESKNELFQNLNEQLDRKNLVAIDYHAYFLIDKKYLTEFRAGRHVSSIVARRQGGQGCEYLIRNSWGPSCKSYEAQGYECEQGNIWVSQKNLEPNLVGITYVQ